MKIESYFPTLEPPKYGLEILRERLDQRETRRRPLALAAALGVLMVALPWAVYTVRSELREAAQINDLRQTLIEHRSPELAVNGRSADRLRLDSEDIEVYLVEAAR